MEIELHPDTNEFLDLDDAENNQSPCMTLLPVLENQYVYQGQYDLVLLEVQRIGIHNRVGFFQINIMNDQQQDFWTANFQWMDITFV